MSSLLVRVPPSHPEERRYAVTVLLEHFLGLEAEIVEHDEPDVRITLWGDPRERTLVVTDGLLGASDDDWLTERSMPVTPLATWNIAGPPFDAPRVGPRLPVLYGAPVAGPAYAAAANGTIHLGLDVFGGAFFLLTRYEEMVDGKHAERDEHDRFPAHASLAAREGFLERAVVDEYVEVLWAAMKRLWPTIERRERTYRVLLSHDVDLPLGAHGGIAQVATAAAGDVLRRADPGLAARRLHAYLRPGTERSRDPYNTFDFIMERSERHGIRSAFNFFGGRTSPTLDADYDVGEPWFRGLIRRVAERGHEVGLHPSYETCTDAAQTKREFERVRVVAAEEGVEQSAWGGRQHFLRWSHPDTWQHWQDAGLDYDSTLGFADRVGFRCGTCSEYPVFNLRTGKTLRLTERPLVVMDNTLLESRYMEMDREAAFEHVGKLADHCRAFDGDFVLLWHNSSLAATWQKDLYDRVLDRVTA